MANGWSDRVAFSGGADGYAYRPQEVVVVGDEARDQVVAGGLGADVEEVFPTNTFGVGGPTTMYRISGEFDPLDTIEDLRTSGRVAQPNHVLFAHGDCGCCCRPHPADRGVAGSPVYATPVYATPVYATPVYATPVYATPVYATPVYATEYRATGKRKSSARPAATAPPVPDVSAYAEGGPHVVVLDTGLASANLRPAFLRGVQCPDKECEEPDEDDDHYLDPAAGHGTFIAGLIRLLAPGCRVTVRQVLSTYGDGDEVAIARTIASLGDDVDILNLSFGGYTPERMHALAAAVRLVQRRGTVVVASAGNDGTCRPAYPAALPGVVGVAALGPDGPARFSNYGDWVRACAPGVDIVSAFFSMFDGRQSAPAGGTDPDRFRDWATWSGSSFSAPIVAAAIAREMHVSGCKAPDAVTRVVDGPGLFRIPDMGTVVNLR